MPKTLLRVHLRVRIEAEKNLLVAERVLLLHGPTLRDRSTLDGTQHTLHLRAVNELGDIRLRDDVGWEEEVTLELAGLGGAAVNGVESGEGGGCPDDEAAEVQSVLRPVKGAAITKRGTVQKKNPLRNKQILLRLNPYAKVYSQEGLGHAKVDGEKPKPKDETFSNALIDD